MCDMPQPDEVLARLALVQDMRVGFSAQTSLPMDDIFYRGKSYCTPIFEIMLIVDQLGGQDCSHMGPWCSSGSRRGAGCAWGGVVGAVEARNNCWSVRHGIK
jgi:hypothetical protein